MNQVFDNPINRPTTTEVNNLSDHLAQMAARFPNKPVLLHPVKITYKELDNEVNNFAHGLNKIGITKGKRTILLIPPGLEFIIVTFALLRIGAVLVMIDPGMGAKAMAHALKDVEVEAFIGISRAHLLRLFYTAAFKSTKIIVTLGHRWFLQGYRFSDLRSEQKKRFPSISTNLKDVAGIFFTSGSTGPAKGVVFTNAMLNAQIELLNSHFNYNPKEIELCTFPLLSLFSICLGLSLVLPDMNTAKPGTINPQKVVANIQDYNCTHMFCSPLILNKLTDYCQKNQIRLLSFKRINTAGAPVPLSLLKTFTNLLSEHAEIHTPYGATEALPITDITANELLQINKKSVGKQAGICIGRQLNGMTVKIIKITDEPVPLWENVQELLTGEIGEIVVKGAVVSPEYFNKPKANLLSKIKNSQTGEIWHRMGDVGCLDETGCLWFYGRKSHRVETSRQTLFPIPCETVFNQHPLVSRSALVGIQKGKNSNKIPVVCIQVKKNLSRNGKIRLIQELLKLGAKNPITKEIKIFLFTRQFPVDARHNAKIQREKLALWAERKIR